MELHPFLRCLMLGPVTSHKNISVVGVFGADVIAEELLLLDEAMQTGYFTVTDSGQVSPLFRRTDGVSVLRLDDALL